MKATTQIEKDIAFCIDELELTDYQIGELLRACLLYTSPSPRDVEESRMPSSA